MDFETINNKMIEKIEEVYLKDFHKEIKMFQVIMAGYNASKYKSLQVFKKYGWKVFPVAIANSAMDFIFEYHIPNLNSNVEIHMIKNLKTGILIYSPFLPRVRVDVIVDKNDEIFNTIKEMENAKEIKIGVSNEYGNNLIGYKTIKLVDKYKLLISYKK